MSLRVSSHLVHDRPWVFLQSLFLFLILTNEINELLTDILWFLLGLFPYWPLTHLRSSRATWNNVIAWLVELFGVLSTFLRHFFWSFFLSLNRGMNVLRTNELKRVQIFSRHPGCEGDSLLFVFRRLVYWKNDWVFFWRRFSGNWFSTHMNKRVLFILLVIWGLVWENKETF